MRRNEPLEETKTCKSLGRVLVAIATACFFLFSASPAFAEESPAPVEESSTSAEEEFAQPVYDEDELRRARNLRTAGIVVTAGGLLSLISAAAIFVGAAVEDAQVDPEYPTMGGAMLRPVGVSVISIAVALLAAGVPLWAVGQSRLTRSLEARAAMFLPSLSFNPRRSEVSLGLSVRF